MDAHPVPKNVLTVEFKLFGSLTVNQFLKILFGCIAAIVIYVLGLHPVITWPLIIASITIGVMSAFSQGFESRLNTIIRSVFVSSRYVWRKSTKSLSVLQQDSPTTSAVSNSKPAPNTTKSTKQTFDDISIDRLLDARASYQQASAEKEVPTNFERIYTDVYGADAEKQAATNQTYQPNTLGRVGINSAPRPLTHQTSNTRKIYTVSDYEKELANLNIQLAHANKEGDQSIKQQILDRINTIYSEMKDLAKEDMVPEQSPPDSGKLLYGIVVDSKDRPLAGVGMQLFDLNGRPVLPVLVTDNEGKFVANAGLPIGEYGVRLSSATHKFSDYKIKVEDGRVPAFKFRAK